MCLVLFELGPNQKLEATQASSLKCLRQPAQILLDSAVRVVRPADIYEASAAGGSHLDLVFHWPGSMAAFQLQVQENHLVATCCLHINKW